MYFIAIGIPKSELTYKSMVDDVLGVVILCEGRMLGYIIIDILIFEHKEMMCAGLAGSDLIPGDYTVAHK